MAGSWTIAARAVIAGAARDGRLINMRSTADAVKSDLLKRAGRSDSISSIGSKRPFKRVCCWRAFLSRARRTRCGCGCRKLFGGRLAVLKSPMAMKVRCW
eukprot:4860134-Pyramimonas_sp.AAC.1